MTTTQITRTDPVGLAVAAEYDSVARCMIVTVNGTRHAVSVHEAHELAEQICEATDCRSTAHPYPFARAAVLVHEAITADMAVA